MEEVAFGPGFRSGKDFHSNEEKGIVGEAVAHADAARMQGRMFGFCWKLSEML